VNIYGETQAGPHRIVFQLQEQQGEYVEPVDDGHLFYLHLQPTPVMDPKTWTEKSQFLDGERH
jgi:hypothetical protein